MPTPRQFRTAGKVLFAVAVAGAWAAPASDEKGGPAFSEDGKLLRPADYREWVFASSGLGMTYGPAVAAGGRDPRFDNVFVALAAYRAFLETGTWPEGTILMLEVREAERNVSVNNGGRTQGRVVALEAAVKDGERFPGGGWGYYSFDGPDGPLDSASAFPATASCYACHGEHAAVENTFVQFYPTLFEAAKRHGTIRLDYNPDRKP